MIPANKEEREHMGRVKALGCWVCRRPAEAHHLTKCGRRIGHYFTIPLCFDHHQAQTPLPYGEAVHKGTKQFEAKHGTQMEILEKIMVILYG